MSDQSDIYAPSLERVRMLCASLLEEIEYARFQQGRTGGQNCGPGGPFERALPSLLNHVEWWAKEILRSVPDDGAMRERAGRGEK
jgi:hypothetical protein